VFVFACLSRRKGRRSRRFDLATLIFPQQLTISTSPVHRTTMSAFVPFVNGSSAPTKAHPVAPSLSMAENQLALMTFKSLTYAAPGIMAPFLYSTLWCVNIYILWYEDALIIYIHFLAWPHLVVCKFDYGLIRDRESSSDVHEYH
jgi:hypothetical protein